MKQTHVVDAETVAKLAEGLHAMAQPLTILRGATGTLKLSSAVSGPDRRYVEMCSTQAERLCVLLATLRDLLDTAQSEAVEPSTHTDGNITSDCVRAAV